MSNIPNYQVFISHKKSDGLGQDTKESLVAQQVHQLFNSRGIVSFLAMETIGRIGETEYMKTIDAVLDKVDILIVVASSEDNINSKWIEYEWQSFVNDILSGRKPRGRILTYLIGMSVDELPRPLRLHQSLVHGDGQLERLFHSVATALGISELDRFAKAGAIAVDRFYEMIEVMAASRRLEMEIFSGSQMGRMVMTSTQHEEMVRLTDKLENLTKQCRSQQDGTGQPAIRPDSKSGGSDKPQPDSDARPQ